MINRDQMDLFGETISVGVGAKMGSYMSGTDARKAIPDTEHLIGWFWEAVEKEFPSPEQNAICQCATDKIIGASGDSELARAFLLSSVAIDMAMRSNPFFDYESFVRQFRFPRLESHGGGGSVSADWVIHPYHGYDKLMDWPLGAAVFSQLANSLKSQLIQSTWGEAAFRHFSAHVDWIAPVFEKYDKAAADSIRTVLKTGRASDLFFGIAELRKRPDLVMHLLKLTLPGSQVWDTIVSVGIEIVRDTKDGRLGMALVREIDSRPALDANLQREDELLNLLLQIVAENEDARLAVCVGQHLSTDHHMKSHFIDHVASFVKYHGDGPLAVQLWGLTREEDPNHAEALRIALEAAIVTDSPSLLYDVLKIAGKQHPAYPDVIERLLAAVYQQPSQSSIEKLMNAVGEEHPAFMAVMDLADKHMIYLPNAVEHRRRRKEEAIRLRARMLQQRQSLQREISYQRHKLLESMAQLQPHERLAYLARQDAYPLAYYPSEWAAVSNSDIWLLDDKSRISLMEKLKVVRKGPWRELMGRLQRGMDACATS